MKISASIERLHEVIDYNPDTGIFVWKTRAGTTTGIKIWNKRFSGKVAGNISFPHGFPVQTISIDNKAYRAHRLAWAYFYGYWPENEIDHINVNPLDNRIVNLREATRSQNECNKSVRCDNALGVKGVYFDKTRNKYMVQIKKGGIHLRKRVQTLDQAIKTHSEWVDKYHGEYGRVENAT